MEKKQFLKKLLALDFERDPWRYFYRELAIRIGRIDSDHVTPKELADAVQNLYVDCASTDANRLLPYTMILASERQEILYSSPDLLKSVAGRGYAQKYLDHMEDFVNELYSPKESGTT